MHDCHLGFEGRNTENIELSLSIFCQNSLVESHGGETQKGTKRGDTCWRNLYQKPAPNRSQLYSVQVSGSRNFQTRPTNETVHRPPWHSCFSHLPGCRGRRPHTTVSPDTARSDRWSADIAKQQKAPHVKYCMVAVMCCYDGCRWEIVVVWSGQLGKRWPALRDSWTRSALTHTHWTSSAMHWLWPVVQGRPELLKCYHHWPLLKVCYSLKVCRS